MIKRILILIGALSLCACAFFPSSIEDTPLKPVAGLDLDRYMGRWYMIANIPYFAERGNVGVYVEYTRWGEGLILDHYYARNGFDKPLFNKKGQIELFDKTNNAEGRITFFPAPAQDFAVLYLDDQYQYTMIGHPSRNFCWLFSRQPSMPDDVYKKMLSVMDKNRFDSRRVLKIPQRPEQQGAPGFQ